jgi:hypothetical protein
MFPVTDKIPNLWAVNSSWCSEQIPEQSYSCLTVMYIGKILIAKKGSQF